MNRDGLRMLVAALVGGLLFFALLMGASQLLVSLNARWSPGMPWFPLPVLVLLWLATGKAHRAMDIRLQRPRAGSFHGATGFALLATLAAMCISLLEAHYHGLTRTAPDWPGVDSSVFQLSVLLVIPFTAAVLAEFAFRGIIQTQLERVLPLWPMLLLVAVLNALMHFYDPEQASQWVRFLALNFVWGYITWRSCSMLPALIAHVAMNIVEPVTAYLTGPVDTGAFGPGELGIISAVGLLSFAAALYCLRELPRPA